MFPPNIAIEQGSFHSTGVAQFEQYPQLDRKNMQIQANSIHRKSVFFVFTFEINWLNQFLVNRHLMACYLPILDCAK